MQWESTEVKFQAGGQKGSDICVKDHSSQRMYHTKATEETMSPVRRPQWELNVR